MTKGQTPLQQRNKNESTIILDDTQKNLDSQTIEIKEFLQRIFTLEPQVSRIYVSKIPRILYDGLKRSFQEGQVEEWSSYILRD